MCLAKAYASEGEKESLILEDVASVRIEGNKLLLQNLFGEQKEVDGTIREINFQNSRLTLEVPS